MKPFTFDQWWYDYKMKFGLGDSRELIAMAAWQAALENAPVAEAAPSGMAMLMNTDEPRLVRILELLRQAREYVAQTHMHTVVVGPNVVQEPCSRCMLRLSIDALLSPLAMRQEEPK